MARKKGLVIRKRRCSQGFNVSPKKNKNGERVLNDHSYGGDCRISKISEHLTNCIHLFESKAPTILRNGKVVHSQMNISFLVF